MLRRVGILAFMALLGAGGLLAFRMVHSQVAVDLYRARLQTLSHDYEQLRANYNEAVRKTAVTELLIDEGRLYVVVRTAHVQKVIPTPFDPSREIYVDYVVADGRLWIRRVFDDTTAPEHGLVIDPARARIDWHAPGVAHGKAVYRRLDEGRWVITVTGDGSLGLARAPHGQSTYLAPPPPVKDYPLMDREVSAELDQIAPADVLKHLVTP